MDSVALRVLVTPPSGYRAIPDQAARELGFPITMSVLPTEKLLQTATLDPESFDLIQAEYWMINELRRSGSIQPIPAGDISHYRQIIPLFTEGTVGGHAVSESGIAPHRVQFADERPNGANPWLNAVPTICNSDTLGWRSDLVEHAVTSWGDLLSPELAGSVAVADLPAVSHLELSLACRAKGRVSYGDIGEQSVAEIDQTYAVLDEFAESGHFDGLWESYETSVERMADGFVGLQSLWPPAVTALKKRGVPIRYGVLDEGARGWAGGLCLSARIPDRLREQAIAYINWYLGGWAGAFLMRQGYYSATPELARRHLGEAEWQYWQEGRPATTAITAPDGAVIGNPGEVREGGSFVERMSRIVCWNTRMAEEPHLRRRWGLFREKIKRSRSQAGATVKN